MTESAKEDGRMVTLGCQFCLTLNRVDVTKAHARPKCGQCGKPILLDRPVKVTDDTLGPLVRDADIPILVDFHADWCAPCKIMAPLLDEVAQANVGELLVAKLDTDLNPKSSLQYGIRGIPTLILFRDGQEVERRTGAVPRDQLDALVSSAAG